jgi:hypothetical protein
MADNYLRIGPRHRLNDYRAIRGSSCRTWWDRLTLFRKLRYSIIIPGFAPTACSTVSTRRSYLGPAQLITNPPFQKRR